VTDYIIESDKAKKLVRARQFREALGIYLALADEEELTPRQELLALERAVSCVRGLKDGDMDGELRARLESLWR